MKVIVTFLSSIARKRNCESIIVVQDIEASTYKALQVYQREG